MIEIKLYNIAVDQVMPLVRAARDEEMVQGIDWDFKFIPTKWNGWEVEEQSHITFLFYKEEYATMFALKHVK